LFAAMLLEHEGIAVNHAMKRAHRAFERSPR
jgi:hypothetical protein